jgi:hypothetical protein
MEYNATIKRKLRMALHGIAIALALPVLAGALSCVDGNGGSAHTEASKLAPAAGALSDAPGLADHGGELDTYEEQFSRITAVSVSGEQVPVKPLDADTNPYGSAYDEFDRWAVSHAREPGSGGLTELLLADDAGDVHIHSCLVDPEGFVIPHAVAYRLSLAEQFGEETPEAGALEQLSFMAAGPLPDSTREQAELKRAEVLAEFIGPVPEWLGASPPVGVWLLEDGRAVVMGDLGAGAEVGEEELYELEERAFSYTLYSAAGEPLRTVEPGHEWFEACPPNMDEIRLRLEAEELSMNEMNGYIVLFDANSWKDVAAYSLSGEAVALEEALAARQAPYIRVAGKQLRLVYELQDEPAG